MLAGSGHGIGETLVTHPAIQAVGFTGSRGGGTALMAACAARPQPIPVYAEMSSINPWSCCPVPSRRAGLNIAAGFATSLTMGVGQFCTNPGLVLGLASPELDAFAAAAAALARLPAGTMLTPGIASAYQRGEAALAANGAVTTLQRGSSAGCQGAPALYRTSGSAFQVDHSLRDEVFGPASLVVACQNMDELLAVLEGLEGQLTATLQLQSR